MAASGIKAKMRVRSVPQHGQRQTASAPQREQREGQADASVFSPQTTHHHVFMPPPPAAR